MNPESNLHHDVSAVVLAGGRATRMGGIDKGLVKVLDRPMIAFAVEALSNQVATVVINANRNQAAYQRYASIVVGDATDSDNRENQFLGPLAGMLAALQKVQSPFLVTAPCDSPLVPTDLVRRLWHARTQSDVPIAVAHDGERLQPVFCLLDQRLIEPLRAFLAAGERKIDRFFANVGFVTADFSDCRQAFLNINTEEDRLKLETLLKEQGAPAQSNQLKANAKKPHVLGFAAYSGAGKTTLLKHVIPLLRQSGLRIAVIKHAHHAFDVDVPGKDSQTLRNAGADQIIVSSKQRRAWIVEHDTKAEPSLDELIDSLADQPIDLIIVEGYKKAAIAKIEIHRPSLGARLLAPDDSNVIAVATDQALSAVVGIPQLNLNEHKLIASFIGDWMQGKRTC